MKDFYRWRCPACRMLQDEPETPNFYLICIYCGTKTYL